MSTVMRPRGGSRRNHRARHLGQRATLSLAGGRFNPFHMPDRDNPYTSPQCIDRTIRIPSRFTARRMLALLSVGVSGGALLGVLTNSVNGAVSPQYFRDVMGWSGSHIWLRAVGEGALEGAGYALAYGILFMILIATVSQRRCRFRTAMRYVGFTFALALGFWLLGGAAAVACAWLFPSVCNPRYFGHNITWPAFGCYAWVRGSIQGIVDGGLASVLITSAVYARRHRAVDRAEYDTLVLASQDTSP